MKFLESTFLTQAKPIRMAVGEKFYGQDEENGLKSKMNPGLLPDLTIPNAVMLDLMQATLARNATFRFRAQGGSMSPFIRAGDVLLVDSLHGQKPAVGQVVAFIHPGSGLLIVHRVVRRQASGYLIQGDHMPGRDDGIVPEANILGRVIKVKRRRHGVWFGQGGLGLVIAWLSHHKLLIPLSSALRRLVGRWARI